MNHCSLILKQSSIMSLRELLLQYSTVLYSLIHSIWCNMSVFVITVLFLQSSNPSLHQWSIAGSSVTSTSLWGYKWPYRQTRVARRSGHMHASWLHPNLAPWRIWGILLSVQWLALRLLAGSTGDRPPWTSRSPFFEFVDDSTIVRGW